MMELILVLAVLAIIIAIIVPTYSVLTQRMNVNADKSSAGNLAHAVRAWYSDCLTDETIKSELSQMPIGELVPLNSVNGLERYLNVETKPISLLNANKMVESAQKFFAGLIANGDDVRVVIAIGTTVFEIEDDIVADYDGTEPGIIYIER